tara:strand:+ start:2489 stop:2896 length:408 start_codon:yes stop_codon:yes gene_type:complete
MVTGNDTLKNNNAEGPALPGQPIRQEPVLTLAIPVTGRGLVPTLAKEVQNGNLFHGIGSMALGNLRHPRTPTTLHQKGRVLMKLETMPVHRIRRDILLAQERLDKMAANGEIIKVRENRHLIQELKIRLNQKEAA